MRELQAKEITSAVKRLCMEANYYLGEDVLNAVREGLKKEESPLGKDILQQIVENAEIAAKEEVPICQDTGFAVIFVELGQEVRVVNGDLTRPSTRASDRVTPMAICANRSSKIPSGGRTPAITPRQLFISK